VNRFKSANTLIFSDVNQSTATFTAVLDYHGAPAKPDYCAHMARYEMQSTPEWRTWMDADRQNMAQVVFAIWLEDNLKLVVEPESATLLEMVTTLHGHKNARFNDAVRLQTGAFSVNYEEDVSVRSGKPGAGALELPGTITAGIAVFQGGAPYKVKARLKTVIAERQLHLRFETIGINEIVRDSIMEAVKQIGEKTGIIPLLGNP
jgi:uncharacterized protein YfdQ (DUF2303 family)